MRRPDASVAAVAATLLFLCVAWIGGAFARRERALFAPLPIADPDRLQFVEGMAPFAVRNATPQPLFQIWRERNRTFEDLAAFVPVRLGEARGLGVSSNFFRVLGVYPDRGRTFLREEEREGRAVVVSHAFARELGANIGDDIDIGGREYQVVGIMPPAFRFAPADGKFWVALGKEPRVGLIGRLLPDADRWTAAADLRRTALKANYIPGPHLTMHGVSEELRRDLTPAIAIFAAASFVAISLAALEFWRLRALRRWSAISYAATMATKSLILLAGILSAWLLFVDPEEQFLGSGYAGSTIAAGIIGFALLSAGAVYLSWLDHRYRCRVCLCRLRMPLQTGSLGAPLLDLPGTEYICPFGHGKLLVPEAPSPGADPDNWTYYGDLWHELETSAAGKH